MANDMDSERGPVADGTAGGEMQVSCEQEDEPSILDLMIILAARKRLIFAFVLAGGVLSAALAFLTAPTFTATAVIMPPQQQSSTAAAMLGQLGGMAGLASQSLGIKNPADPYVGILSSRTVADALIAQFGLKDVYKEKTMTAARKQLAGNTSFNSAKYGMIMISVKDGDPRRAADLANAYVDRLQAQNSRLALTESSQRRLFFERQLEAEKNNLADAEAAFRKMQEQKGIFQVSSQVEAVIHSMAQMRAEISAREVYLQRVRTGATTQNPEVLRQEAELTALRSQLKELEKSSVKRSQGDPLMPITMLPEAGMEYVRRLRDVKYREALYELLARQYEAARIDEAKESPVIQVVDTAIPPDRKSAPSRSAYILIGIFLGGALGLITAFLAYAVRNPMRADKVEALKKLL